MHVLSLLLCVFKPIQLGETENLNKQTYVKVLHASLKEQPLLLSISWDPSSTPKINKCL